MKNSLCIFVFFYVICISQKVFSQTWTLKGTVINGSNRQLIPSGITILEDSLENHLGFSEIENGHFSIILPIIPVQLTINVLGFYSLKQQLFFDPNNKNPRTFFLQKDSTYLLQEVIVKQANKGIYELPDTVIYKVKNLKLPDDRKIEDLLKRLPGLEVDENSGMIKYRNKNISTVLIDGENLVDRNYTLATKNLNIDDIDEVQALDHFSENSIISSLGSSNEVALNLTFAKKFTITNNSTLDAGLVENQVNALGIVSNTIINTKKVKTLLNVGLNNLGDNNSKIDYSSFQSADKMYEHLPEKLFSVGGPFLNSQKQKANRNQQWVGDLSALLKLHKNIKIRFNSMSLMDEYDVFQRSTNRIYLPELSFETSDKNAFQTQVKKWDKSVYSKFQPNQHWIMEGTYAFNTSRVKYANSQTINEVLGFQSQQDATWTDRFIESLNTLKIGKKSALQYNISHTQVNNHYSLAIIDRVSENTTRLQEFDHTISITQNYLKFIHVFIPKKIITETKIAIFGVNQMVYSPIKLLSDYSENNVDITQNLKGQWNDFKYSVEIGSGTYRLQNSSVGKSTEMISYQISLDYKLAGQSINYTFQQQPSRNYRNYIIADTLFTDIRNLRKDSLFANIPIKETHSIHLSNDIKNDFYYVLALNYSKTAADYYDAFQLSRRYSLSQKIWLNKPMEIFFGRLEMNYFLNALSINLKAVGDFNQISFPILLNQSTPRSMQSANMHWGLGVKTGFLKNISIQNFLDVYNNINTNNSKTIANTTYRNQLGIFFRKHTYTFRFAVNSYKFAPNVDFLHFMDASVEYRPQKSKFTCGLKGSNLLDNRVKNYITVTNYSSSSQENFLVGRSLIVSIVYSL
ncbi:hypothetical protein V7S79_05555 [Aquirufa sp. ROCK-SH2]